MNTAHNLKIFRGVSILTLSDLFVAVFEIARIILITRLFSIAEFGLYGIALGTAMMLKGLVTPGFRHVIQRFYPQYIKENSVKAKSFLFSTLVITFLNAVVIMGIAYAFSEWMATTYYEKSELIPYLQVSLLIILVESLNGFFTAALMSLEKFKSIFWVNLLQSVVSTLGVIAIFYWGGSITTLILTLIFGTLGRVVICFALLLPYLHWSVPRLDKTIVGFWLPLIPASFFNGLTIDLPAVILGRLLTATDIGLYKIAERTIQMIVSFLDPYTSTVVVICLNIYHDSKDQFVRLLRQHFKLVGIVGLGLTGLSISGAVPLFELLYGDQYSEAVPVFLILSFYIMFSEVLFYQQVIYSVTNQTQQMLYYRIISTMLFFILLWGGAVSYGLVGAAIGTVSARVIGFFLAWILTSRVMKGAIQYRALIIPFGVALAFDVVLLRWLPETLPQAIGMAVIYLPLFLATLLVTRGLDPRFLKTLRNAWINRSFNPQSQSQTQPIEP